MALSYCPNWPEFTAAIDDPDLQSLSFNPDDFLVDPNDSSLCNSLLLSDFVPFNYTTTQPPPPFFPHHHHQQEEKYEPFFPLSKRQKFYDSWQFLDTQPPEFVISPAPAESTAADFGVRVKEEGGGRSLSAQSIAARQRRRRITVKTQELGKLVPGGTKMNTAEMLQSAYKYIKFLQAQAALLGIVGSLDHEVKEESPLEGEEEFQNLLESPLIQEKLYSTEHCLVPQKLLKSNPHLLEKDN